MFLENRKSELPKRRRAHRKKKVTFPENEKIYKVTVSYVQLTKEEGLLKRAIVERIIRKLSTSK